jgi:capsular exopolysaccharide synthesis family protein
MGRGKFLRSLKQRWWLLLLLVLPVTLGTLFWTVYSPAKFEAFMTLADRRPTDIGQTVLYQDELIGRAVNDQEIRVLNLANTIGSYTVLKTAYDELVQTQILDQKKEDEIDFVNDVKVNPLRGTEYLQVSYVADNPKTARSVIDTIHKKFMSRYRQLASDISTERTKFVREQLKAAQASYNEKLQKQKEFQEAHPGGIAYDANSQALLMQLNQAKQRLAEAEGRLAVAKSQYQTAKDQLNNKDVTKPSGNVQEVMNPVWNSISDRLGQSQSTLQGLLKRYGPKHPQVVAVQRSIEEDQALLKNTERTIKVGMQPDMSPIQLDAAQAMYQAERALDGAEQDRENSLHNIAAIKGQIDQLPVVQKELASLNAELLAESDSVKNLPQKLGESLVRAAQNENPTIYMLDNPTYREVPRNTTLKTLIALFLSSIVAVSLIASLGQVDQGTYTPIEAENSLGFPVIAVLPRSSQQRLSTGAEQATALAASYQMLSTEIMAVKEKLVGPGILVAAAEPNSGRSTVAANLAISLARDGARVLLIDSDLRAPSLHTHFGLENRSGLSEILQGSATVENVVQPTGVDGLLFISAGQPPVNPVKLFHGEAIDQFVELVSKGADYIIFDSPAGSTFGDAAILAMNVQNVVLVHEAGKPPSVSEYEFHKSLERLGINVIGMVLNKARQDDCPAYQHFRRNYESTLGRYRPGSSPAALGAGDKPVRTKSEQYGATKEDDEE